MAPPRHILVLTDRDWTHPQGGGTGTHLYGIVSRWIAWGHRVTVIAGDYPGAARVERPAPNLELHHVGSRLTVFPRAAWLVKRGAVKDVDVVLEVVNGIAFFTPLWRLRIPRVAQVYHVHRDMYVEELGRRGAVAAWLLETLPLRHLYAGTRFLTISHAAEASLVELGVDPDAISVVYSGVEADAFHAGTRSPRADAALPRAAQALQAARGPARRARGHSRGPPARGGRGRPPRGVRGRDRRARARRPGHAARLRGRGRPSATCSRRRGCR